MGLIKPPAPAHARADSLSVTRRASGKWDPDLASVSKALASLLPKDDVQPNGATKPFNDFRETDSKDTNGETLKGKGKKPIPIPGLDGKDDEPEILMADEFGRDHRDGLREVMKTEEEVRLEEELVGGVDRIKVCFWDMLVCRLVDSNRFAIVEALSFHHFVAR